jgi:hypothetical protein
MSRKYETADAITVGAAELMYEHGVCSIVTDGKYVQIEKETAQEVPVQEQSSININELRIKHGLEPIPDCDYDLIPIK